MSHQASKKSDYEEDSYSEVNKNEFEYENRLKKTYPSVILRNKDDKLFMAHLHVHESC